MSVLLTSAIYIDSVLTPVGTTVSLGYDREEEIVSAGEGTWVVKPTTPIPPPSSPGFASLTTSPSGGVAIAGSSGIYQPVLAGLIVLAKPTIDGVSTSGAQPISSQVISTTMTGEKLLFSTVQRDDFGGMAARILTNPGEILIPSGVRFARFTLSTMFPAEAASGANGFRANRILQGATPEHQGNASRPAVADFGNSVVTTTAIIGVTAGEYYWGGAIQNCGSSLNLAFGAEANNWSSNWFMAELFA